MTKKLLIIGNYGAGNLGDDAILGGILVHLRALGWKGGLSVTHGGVSSSTDIYRGLEKVPFYPVGLRSRLNGRLRRAAKRAFQSAEGAILGGGGLFTDSESLKAPYIWYRQAMACVRFGVPYICYAQSVGPLGSWLARRWARFVFSHAQAIHVRDTASAQILKNLGIVEVTVGTDAALAYLLEHREKSISKEKILLFIPRLWPGVSKKEWSALIPLLQHSAEAEGWKCIGMSMGVAAFEERSLFKALGVEAFEPGSALQAFEAIQKAQRVVSMRLHGGIFALAARVPFIALSYTPKVQNFFNGVLSEGVSVLDLEEATGLLPAALKELKILPPLLLEDLLYEDQQFLARAILNF